MPARDAPPAISSAVTADDARTDAPSFGKTLGMIADVFLDIPHELGEGVLWHEERGELFWCSIHDGELHACSSDGENHRMWRFGEAVSATAIVDRGTLLVATASGLVRFDIDVDDREVVCIAYHMEYEKLTGSVLGSGR